MKIYFKLLIISATLFLVKSVFAGYETNSFFVTPNEWSSVVTPDQIEDAKTNIECQPSENDPNGHWGPIYYGYQLSIRLNKDMFQTNEPVIATIIYRNTGTNVLHHGTPYGGDLDFQIAILDENGRRLPDSFVPQRTTGHGSQWQPGTQYKCQSNLTQRYGLIRLGTYSVSVHRRLSNPEANGWINLASGTATIKIVAATNSPSSN